MSRSLLVILLAAACASCVVDPIRPDVWSLARSDANNNDVYLGGHLSLEACQRAGFEWFTTTHQTTGVLQCRLNCRRITKDEPYVCEATEPVG
ncbi:MAG TPA: hypothetical protein VFE34_02150 [Dongiaceae bacterium]|jgi:hypothetical protein|nr:hypothetical protein [Dongiaceae bacterium]